MSDKTRIALILGGIGVVAAAGGGYLFKVHLPAKQRAAAQAEVVAWEQRLDAARACLLGPAPASGKSREALAIRELSPDPWERGTCTKLIGKLSRGVADDTGLLPVEHAWMAIDRASSKVASAFATHVDPFGEAPGNRPKESPLPDALEALDDAHAALRQAAGMAPPPAAAIPALRAAEELPLVDGDKRLTRLEANLAPSAGGILAFGSGADDLPRQIVLAPGAAPKVARLAPGAIRALPDLSWAATAMSTQLAVGAVDAAGAFASPSTLPLATGAQLLFAAGAPGAGLVGYATGGPVMLARVANGAFTADPPTPMGPGNGSFVVAADLDGRVALAWSGTDGAIGGTLIQGGGALAPVPLGSGYVRDPACLTPTHAWLSTGEQFVSFDGVSATPRVLPEHDLLGCTADGALLRGEGAHYALCGAGGCRPVDLPGFRGSGVATAAGGKVIAVLVRERVLGVWREGGAPAYFALSASFTPRRAHSDGKVIDVLGTTEAGPIVVRVPAT